MQKSERSPRPVASDGVNIVAIVVRGCETDSI